MPFPPAYALVATDLDGTLLRRDDSVSPRTRAALALAARAGARHLVVTGRPVPGIRGLLDELGYRGPVVCGQGTQLYDAGSGRMVRAVTLDREAADTALGKIEARVGPVHAAVDQDGADGRTLIEPGYLMPHPTLPAQRTRRRHELWAAPVIKVLIRHPELTDDALAEAARTAVGDLASVTLSGPGTVELQPYGVDKEAGSRWPPNSWAWPRTPRSPSGTCPTTCRCSARPGTASRWPTVIRTCGPRRTR